MPWQITLMEVMPKAGLVFQHRFKVHRQMRHDKKTLTAFQKAGVVDQGCSPEVKIAAKEQMDNALASAITLATNPDIINRLQQKVGAELGLFRFCDALKPHLDWAQHLSDANFYSFIHSLITAREAWQVHKRPPFDEAEHCATAKAIDVFLVAARHQWSAACTDLEWLCVAGGLDESDDEGEDDGEAQESEINMEPLGEVLDAEMREHDMISGMDKMDIG